MSRLHPSEKAIARIRNDHGWDRRYKTPRTIRSLPHIEPRRQMPLVRLLNLAFSMLALELMVLAWAISLVMR